MTALVAFALGHLAVLAATAPPPQAVLWLLALLASVMLVARRWVAFALLTGVFNAGVAVQGDLTARWPVARDGERLLAEVRLLTEPSYANGTWQALVELRALRPSEPRAPLRRVQVTWPESVRLTAQTGETWQWLLELRAPRAALNPGGVDLERHYFRRGWHALGRLRPSPLNQRLQAHKLGAFERLRKQVRAAVARHGVDREADALFLALAIGDTSTVDDEQWRVFNATGTTHLIAISGLHVTGFAALMFGLARILWRPLALFGCRWDRERCATLLALAAALSYSVLAGWSVPTQRTMLMLAIACSARLVARSVGGARVLLIALATVLLFDPYAPLALGFWLSFVAMAGLIWVLDRPGSLANLSTLRVQELLRTQWAMTWLLAPLLVLAFGAVSVSALWVNLLAVPFFTLLLVPCVLATSAALLLVPTVGAAALRYYALAYDWLIRALTWAADSPAALVVLPARPIVWWVLLLLVLLCVPPWSWRLRALALSLGLVLFYFQYRSDTLTRPGEVQVWALDSGDAPAILLLTQQHAILVDTGDGWASEGAGARRRVLPALRALGVRKIDLLLTGRATPARAHGLAELTTAIPLQHTIGNGGWRGSVLALSRCEARHWSWDGVQFELWPTMASTTAASNCALRLQQGSREVVIASHLNAAEERALRISRPDWSAASLWVVRHGALRDSALRSWWQSSGAALVSSGRAGDCEPKPALRTGDCGAVQVRLQPAGRMQITALRAAGRRWLWRVDSFGR